MFGKKSEFKLGSIHICVFSAKTFLRKKNPYQEFVKIEVSSISISKIILTLP